MRSKPVHLNLLTIAFPLTAIVSILHRISGVILFLVIPVLLWALAYSLTSSEHFAKISACLSAPFSKFCLWVILSSLLYHLIAGTRHILMDLGVAESKTEGRVTGLIVFTISIFGILVLGYYLW